VAADLVTLLFGIGIGLVLAAALRVLWGLTGILQRSAPVDPVAPFAWDPARGSETPRRPDRPRELDPLDEPLPEPAPRLTVEIRPPPERPEEPEEIPAPRPTPVGPRPDPDGLATSQRVVLHLARLGRIRPDEVAPPGATQAGMTEALGVRQSSLTKVLARLVAGGALSEGRGHVQGAPRRLKVYRLTALGEAIARDLRRPPPGAPPMLAELPGGR